jgi:Mu-like prophage I protein
MDERYIVPCPTHDDWTALSAAPVALARQRKVMGQLYRKHILTEGPLIHPKTGQRINIDSAFMDSLERNFTNGVADIVQVPLANDKNEHVEAPAANLGEVVGLERRDKKLYALIDARQDAAKFGRTYLGASAFLSTDYTDTSKGQKAGPTLLHVAVTNRPYVTNLEDYEQVVAATADGDIDDAVVLTPEEEMPQTREELLAALRDQHGIDVEALQSQAGRAGDVSQLTAALTAALSSGGTLALSGDVTGDDLVGAVAELAQLSAARDEQIATLLRERAEAVVDGYIGQGRLLPKSRGKAIELVLSNPAELDAFLAPENAPYVKLARQEGVSGDTSEGHTQDVDGELARLTAADGPNGHLFSPNGPSRR